MALGDSYATLADLKARLGITDANSDTALTSALASVSRGIERFCGRQFNDAGAVSARVFRPRDNMVVEVDDFSTTTGLVVAIDNTDTGTYPTAIASSGYQLEPLNGIVDGESGWPFYRLRATWGTVWPTWTRRPGVQVTAQWGWAAVPAPVQEACLVLAEETFKLRDAPFGVAGYADYGPIRVRQNPIARDMLAPYARTALLGA